jgi:tRNA(fMet)-specific endonuclease VapC
LIKVETYLLDTSALTPLADASHLKHAAATTLIQSLKNAPIYASAISIAEMMYGLALYEKTHGTKLPNADQMLSDAKLYPMLDIEHHTAAEYAELKATIATYYLPNVTKQFRTKYVEDWVDKFTGKALGIDDNDLWICAQSCEMNFTLIADDKMNRIKKAVPKLKIIPI